MIIGLDGVNCDFCLLELAGVLFANVQSLLFTTFPCCFLP